MLGGDGRLNSPRRAHAARHRAAGNKAAKAVGCDKPIPRSLISIHVFIPGGTIKWIPSPGNN